MNNRAESIFIYGLSALLVVVAWLFVPALANAFSIKTHVALLGILVLMLQLGVARGPAQLHLPRNIPAAGLALLVMSALLSALASGSSDLAVRAGLELLVFVLLVIALLNVTRIDAAQHRLESALLVAATGVALFALKQLLFPAFLDPGFHALGKMKVYSTLGNSNLAALLILPALPLAVFRAYRGNGTWRRVYGTLCVVFLAGLLATQSRHTFLAMAAMSLLATLWFLPTRHRRWLLVALGLGIVVGAAVLLWVDPPSALVHSVKGRWFIWNTAAEMLRQNPWLGVGLGHFGVLHPEYQAQLFASGQFNNYYDNAALIEEAHNQFLHWGATIGVVGLAGFTMLCTAVLWKGWNSAAVRNQAPQLYLALIGLLVAMLFVATLAYTATALVFWLILALVWRRIEYTPAPWPLTKPLRTMVAIALLALLLLAGFFAVRDIRGGYYEAQGDIRMEERDPWAAAREYQTGLSACPTCTTLRKKYAITLFLSGELESTLLELRIARQTSGDVALRILEGEALARLNRLDEAVVVYRDISGTFPNMASPHFILGQIFALQGNREQATSEFRRVLEIVPSPYNLNLTHDKVELQKDIARQYLGEQGKQR